ncbi:MAG: hypothetical protein Q3992_06585 [Bacteroides sp.]|nr:hypothetical protein [Bacteroides sp.]
MTTKIKDRDFLFVRDIREYPNFYIKMFGHKTINKSLGVTVCFDDADEWLLVTHYGRLCGFCGYVMYSDSIHIKRAYVFGEYRGNRIYEEMIDLMLLKGAEAGKKTAKCAVNERYMPFFQRKGFTCTSCCKYYNRVEKKL